MPRSLEGRVGQVNDSPIGIFDSGVGGLTVARAILDQLPNESTLYIGDTARTPYGARPIAEVRTFALHAHIDDHANFVVEYRCGEAKRGDVGAHQATWLVMRFVDDDFITERQEVVGHGQRRRSASNASNAFAVLVHRNWRQQIGDVIAQVGGDAFEAADRHRFAINALPAAGRFAGAVTGSPQDRGEDVGLAVDHVCVGETALGDQPDVFGHVGVSGTGPLAIDDLVVIRGIADVGRFHSGNCLRTDAKARSPGLARKAPRMAGRPLTGRDQDGSQEWRARGPASSNLHVQLPGAVPQPAWHAGSDCQRGGIVRRQYRRYRHDSLHADHDGSRDKRPSPR